MLLVIAQDEIFQDIVLLNCRQLFAMQRIDGQNPKSCQSAIEQAETATHVLIDINGIKNNIDLSLELIERISITKPHLHLIVVAAGYDYGNVLIRDIKQMGNIDIINSSGAAFKKSIVEILVRDGVLTVNTPYSPAQEGTSTEPTRPDTTITPPSQMDRTTSKSMMKPKPPVRPLAQKAVTIAVAGAGRHMGTTTQAMQLVWFLRSKDARVAIIEIGCPNSLFEYFSMFEDAKELENGGYQIAGIDLYTTRNSIAKAKNNYEYLVCDYGNYLDLPDETAFLDKEIKVIVGGIKPWESQLLNNVFEADDGSIKYIFNFVPGYDRDDVKLLMQECGDNTFFAEYAPDYWSYCGNDELYQTLLGTPVEKPSPTTPKRRTLFGFGRK